MAGLKNASSLRAVRAGILASIAISLLFAAACSAETPGRKSSKQGPLVFEDHIRPILKAHCFDCHGEGEQLKGGLDLRLVRSMIKGGESGTALIPGKPAESHLLKLIASGEMPKRDRKPTPSEINLIRTWIAAGAKTLRAEPESLPPGMHITPEERMHWAFQPIRRPTLPRRSSSSRIRTTVDALIAVRQRDVGVAFSEDAPKETLIRRLFFDLWGLPPAPADVEDFLADTRSDAYERLVDRLLDSPHYGERWARHWLDVAGYADSDGYNTDDTPRPYAYKYRDYVIRALNEDRPFDQFISEQLAGDEIAIQRFRTVEAASREESGRELLAATGYLRMAADGTASGSVDQDAARNQVVADTIKIVSSSLLGLTVGCAQCHDHRYDPIPQVDYYRLRAVFEPALDWKQWKSPGQRLVSLYTDEDRKKAASVEEEARKASAARDEKQSIFIDDALKKHLESYDAATRDAIWSAFKTAPDKRTEQQKALLRANPSANIHPGVLYQYNPKAAEELKTMEAKINEIRSKKPPDDFLSILTEPSGARPATLRFHRGDPKQPREEVAPGTLTILASARAGGTPLLDMSGAAGPTSGRRLAFARWATGESNPLLPRVIVNRVWMHHFGRGLVGSPSDFGLQGERPTDPELLDWLASAFSSPPSVDPTRPGLGWSLKKLHRLIVTSTVYRQSSATQNHHVTRDPENRTYWRKPVLRNDAEAIRDSHLAISGALSSKMYGPPVPVREDVVGQIVVGIDRKQGDNKMPVEVAMGEEEFRRSIYVEVRRSKPLAFLNTFDAPVMEVNCERRQSSTVAPQALMLMNSDFTLQQARLFAARLKREGGSSDSSRIRTAWKLVFGRPPSATELSDSLAFLAAQQTHSMRPVTPGAPTSAEKGRLPPAELAWTSLCQTLLISNELLYVD